MPDDWLDCWGTIFAKRNALPNATAYHQDMPDRPRRIDWEWEEIVLACDLVATIASISSALEILAFESCQACCSECRCTPSKPGCQTSATPLA